MKKQTQGNAIGLTTIALSFLVVAAATNVAHAAKNVGYECGTYSAGMLVTLPVAPLNAEVAEVTITFHGDPIKATYVRKGLSQFWYITDSMYIELNANMTAAYWDFTGAEEGEERRAETFFSTCKKRNR